MASIALYSELLHNIGQVTIFATLPSVANDSTNLELLSDRRFFSVSHEGRKVTLELPCHVANAGTVKLPASKLKELSFRLPVAEDVRERVDGESPNEEIAPWLASVMTPETEVACRSCRNMVIKDTVSVWKDLPSENWAEMMDFWHCHKPHVEEAIKVSPDGSSKGYAASNAIKPRLGTAFVDTLHLRLTSTDCIGIERNVRPTSILRCASCGAVLGVDEEHSESIRLYKWNLCLRSGAGSPWEEWKVQNLVCAKILELINSQAVYKFVAYSGSLEDANDATLLWVFSPHTIYSTTAFPGRPRRAMKILYRPLDDPASTLEKQGLKVEELRLPDEILLQVKSDLQSTNGVMPTTARKIQNWNVGFLDRW